MTESLEQIMKGGLDAEQEQPQEEQQDLELSQEVEQEEPVNPDVEKASADGWVSKDEWVERGNDPDDWVSAKKFNERGSMIGQIKSLKSQQDQLERSFQERIDSLNKLHEMQQKTMLAELEAKRNNAVEMGDVDQFNQVQSQIDNLKTAPKQEQTIQQSVDKPAEIAQWESKNEWINDINDPKTPYAQSRYNLYASQGMDVNSILQAVDRDIQQAFPNVNHNRNNAPQVEGNRSKPGRRVERKLQWSDLSREEEKYFHAMPNAWKSKDEYLQAVADSRKS